MSYVTMSDFLGCCGMGEGGFVIYPDAKTALSQPQAFGYLYKQGDQVVLSGPNGPLIVKSTQVFQDAQTALKQPGAYGYVYVQGGKYYLSGPYGPLEIRSPYTPSAAVGTVLSLPPLPVATATPVTVAAPATPAPVTPAPLPAPTGGAPYFDNAGPTKPPRQPRQPDQSTIAGVPVAYVVLGVGALGIVGLALVLKSNKKKAGATQPAQHGFAGYPQQPYGYGYPQQYGYPQPYYQSPSQPPAPPRAANRGPRRR